MGKSQHPNANEKVFVCNACRVPFSSAAPPPDRSNLCALRELDAPPIESNRLWPRLVLEGQTMKKTLLPLGLVATDEAASDGKADHCE